MNKFITLINILDKLREEAPVEYKSYRPTENSIEKLNAARSKAFIHLYLKVKFGLLDFNHRHECITEGHNDGGVDACYIDEENKKIYLIQSKFRENDTNFEQKEITISELLKIDADRISRGSNSDSSGNLYNEKIQKLITKIGSIVDVGRYHWSIVILANLKNSHQDQLSRIISGFPYEVFNFDRCYNELVFPIISGTFFQPDQLIININLAEKYRASSRVVYPVQIGDIECEITLLYVPTLEIARNFHKYKNAILKNNPRSYLDLARNTVNREIAKSIKNTKTNEFSIFNNGITFISDETDYTDRSAKAGRGQIILTNPQIINGGQTAYTLSLLYDESIKKSEDPDKIFGNKEVLIKIITFTKDDRFDEEKIFNLINDISKATNSQSAVKESDRRANDKIQRHIQLDLFTKYGFYYERKRGEFYEGIRSKYISKDKVIDRQEFLRVCYSIAGFPAESWRTGERQLFSQNIFNKALSVTDNIDKCFKSYLCYRYLLNLKQSTKTLLEIDNLVSSNGYSITDGPMAVVYVYANKFYTEPNCSMKKDESDSYLKPILDQWVGFEKFIIDEPHNKEFFRKKTDKETGTQSIIKDFKNYYRGNTLKQDLDNYFKILII